MKKFLIILILILSLVAAGLGIYKNTKPKEDKNQNVVIKKSENLVNKNELSTKVSKTHEETNKIEENINQEKKETEESVEQENKDIEKVEENTNPEVVEQKDTEEVETSETNQFLEDFENYNPESDEVKISEAKAREIAQIGFEESAKRIAGEGADDVDSEKVKLEEINANNYFTRKGTEHDKIYSDIKRLCYVVQRENEMGNGIRIYVDATTGTIIGGAAFGD